MNRKLLLWTGTSITGIGIIYTLLSSLILYLAIGSITTIVGLSMISLGSEKDE